MVQSFKKNDFQPPDFQELFQSLPAAYIVLDTSFTIIAVSDKHCELTMSKREDIVGAALFEVFPDNPKNFRPEGVGNLRASLIRVLATRKPDKMEAFKFDIEQRAAGTGSYEERFWEVTNTPVLDADGFVKWIINCAEDVT
jgi:PAS domain S-box-containing protein